MYHSTTSKRFLFILLLLSITILDACTKKEKEVIIFDNPILDEARVELINDYLSKNGANYEINALDAPETTPFERAQSGKAGSYQIDIIYCGDNLFSNGHWSFTDLLKAGYLACWDDYLETENGKRLYSSLPGKYWKAIASNAKGSIYGIAGYPYALKTNPVYVVNNSLLEKSGYSLGDLKKPIDGLTDICSSIQEGENRNDFNAINIVYDRYFRNSDVYMFNSLIPYLVVDQSSTEKPICYLLENATIRDYLDSIFDLYRNPAISTSFNSFYNSDNWFITIDLRGNAGCFYPYQDGYCTSTQDTTILYPYGDTVVINPLLKMNAVTSYSEHKDAAFDFLYRLYTDPYLSEIAAFGCELVEKDGYIFSSTGSELNFANYLYIGNGFIGRPTIYERKDKQSRLNDLYENAVLPDMAGFYYENDNYPYAIPSIDSVINLDDLFSGRYSSLSDYIQSSIDTFERSGGRELLNDVTEKYKNFITEKNTWSH